MKLGIVYLLTGMQLAARLVVSLYSLRRFYSGPITLVTTRPESHEIASYCVNDPSLRITHSTFREREGAGYTSSYLTKTAILPASPYDRTIFLDADTLIAGSIERLLEAARQADVVATAFCGWSTNREPVREIIEPWRSLQGSPDEVFALERLLDVVLNQPVPAINAGVFATRSRSSFVENWDRLTMLGRNMRTPEETALQLLLPHTDSVVLGYTYNCHPHMPIDDALVRIWHFCGVAHLRSERARQIWLPVYRQCLTENIANIRDWSRVDRLD